MPNDYFEFKQFTVRHRDAAFKVGTDGCLLGAWVATDSKKNILDIGTGSGVIALMLAQRSKATITAIEQDAQSAQQAHENAASSPWSERIRVQHTTLQAFSNFSSENFDLFVCNPPFFSSATPAADPRSHHARHEGLLTLKELFQATKRLSSARAHIAIIIPHFRVNESHALASDAGWYFDQSLHIQPYKHKAPNRTLLLYTTESQKKPTESNMTLYDSPGVYSRNSVQLLKPYYLNL